MEVPFAVRKTPPFARAFDQIATPDKTGDKGVAWIFVKFARGACLADTPTLHDDQAVRHRQRLFLIVRDNQCREAEALLKRPDFVLNL